MKIGLISKTFIYLFLTVLSVICIIPVLYVISISLSNEMDIIQSGYALIPKNFTTIAYQYIFHSSGQLINSYFISIFVTVVGTTLSVLVTATLAYAASRRDYKFSNATSFYVFFTLLFNGGMIPSYILIAKYLNLRDSLLVLILPYVVMPWFVLLMKGFMSTVPGDIIEAAKIDGASEIRTFFVIVAPISLPALATSALLYGLTYWNDWYLSLLYIESDHLVSLQYMLYKLISNVEYLAAQSGKVQMDTSNIPSESVRMATCVIAAGPMMFVFPFFQKYFVKGLTVGAVKG